MHRIGFRDRREARGPGRVEIGNAACGAASGSPAVRWRSARRFLATPLLRPIPANSARASMPASAPGTVHWLIGSVHLREPSCRAPRAPERRGDRAALPGEDAHLAREPPAPAPLPPPPRQQFPEACPRHRALGLPGRPGRPQLRDRPGGTRTPVRSFRDPDAGPPTQGARGAVAEAAAGEGGCLGPGWRPPFRRVWAPSQGFLARIPAASRAAG